MTIDFCEEKTESSYRGPFLGYINPRGQIIDYSILIGEPGHDNWRNPVTPYFLTFISYVVLGDKVERYKNKASKYKNKNMEEVAKMYEEDYEKNKYEGFDDSVLRGPTECRTNKYYYDAFIKLLNEAAKNIHNQRLDIAKSRISNNEWNLLKYDLMNFFEKCYSKKDFFYSFGRIVKVHCFETYCEMYKEFLVDCDYYEKWDYYENYCVITLMSYFKDILVQYLGYDSIERALPVDDLNIFNNLFYVSHGYTEAPYKVIFTSCTNPNERFYNWLLMDWIVQRVPKMIWNEGEQRFVQESALMDYYQTEKEIILGKEIQSIRRKVPKQYREEYFRK